MGNLQAASKALGAMKFLLLSLLFASQAASAVVENSVEEDDVEGEVALLETSDASDIPKDRCGVVVAINEDERLELFTLGHDNLIYHKYQLTAEEWSNWANLRGPDRQLWTKAQVGRQDPRQVKWGEWENLGGVLSSGPRVPIVSNAVNLLEVYVRASDKAFWQKFQIAGHDKGVSWDDWVPLGGVFSSGPEAILNMDGLLDVFGRGPDKAIWHKGQSHINGTVVWNRWNSLGGMTSTGPAVVQRADGLLEVFVRGVDKNIGHESQILANGTLSFGPWKFLGGSTKSFPC